MELKDLLRLADFMELKNLLELKDLLEVKDLLRLADFRELKDLLRLSYFLEKLLKLEHLRATRRGLDMIFSTCMISDWMFF